MTAWPGCRVHAEEDKKRKDEIEGPQPVRLPGAIAPADRQDLGDKVPEDQKKAVEAVAEAKAALDGSDIEAIKKAGEKLTEVGQKLAEIVYADAQAQTAGNNGRSKQPPSRARCC